MAGVVDSPNSILPLNPRIRMIASLLEVLSRLPQALRVPGKSTRLDSTRGRALTAHRHRRRHHLVVRPHAITMRRWARILGRASHNLHPNPKARHPPRSEVQMPTTRPPAHLPCSLLLLMQ
jgi:hypothetical protein